jgi:cytochrome d ubiquinol oxidase subunit I
VPAWEVLISLIGFTLLYGVLAVVDGFLMFRYAKTVPPQTPQDEHVETGDLAMAY